MARSMPSNPPTPVKLDDLELSVRFRNALAGAGVTTLPKLLEHSERSVRAIKGIDRTGLRQIKDRLADRGLCLGYPLPVSDVIVSETPDCKSAPNNRAGGSFVMIGRYIRLEEPHGPDN